MKKLILFLSVVFLCSSAFAADTYKFNPYTGRLDNVGATSSGGAGTLKLGLTEVATWGGAYPALSFNGLFDNSIIGLINEPDSLLFNIPASSNQGLSFLFNIDPTTSYLGLQIREADPVTWATDITALTWNQSVDGNMLGITGDPNTGILFQSFPSGGAIYTYTAPGGTLVSRLNSAGLFVQSDISTNGRFVKRVAAAANATSITPSADSTDILTQANTQAVGTLTINAPTGTPIAGQTLVLRIKSTNVQTFAWNAIYRGSVDTPLPTSSSGATLTDYYCFIYNFTDTRWDFTGANKGF